MACGYPKDGMMVGTTRPGVPPKRVIKHVIRWESQEDNSDIDVQNNGRGNSRNFTVTTHGDYVLQGFRRLRNQTDLCDVTLLVDDASFPVHRAVMASVSVYFKSMFNQEFVERSAATVRIHDVSEQIMRKVIDFVYTGKIEVNVQDVQDVLDAASRFQIMGLMGVCQNFVIREISLETCIDIMFIAERYHLTCVENDVDSYILENFNAVSKTPGFLTLNMDKLCFFLGSNRVKGCTEIDLFNAATKWLRHEPNRLQMASRVVENIRFPLISPSDLVQFIQCAEFMRTDPKCMALLKEAADYQRLKFAQPVLVSPRTHVRSECNSLVTIGGAHADGRPSDVASFYDYKMKKWRTLVNLEVPVKHHGVAVMGGFVWVVGGMNRNSETIATGYRYDPWRHEWVQISQMNEPRACYHLAVIHDRLYAIAGRQGENTNTTSITILRTAEKYIPEDNRWEYIAELPNRTDCPAGAVHVGTLYISGGFDQPAGFLPHMRCYDAKLDLWQDRKQMPSSRGFHSMAVIKNKIYIIGGHGMDDRGGYDTDLLDVDIYLPGTDTYEKGRPMLRGQGCSGCTVLEGVIYVVGGGSRISGQPTNVISVFNSLKEVWEEVVMDFIEPMYGTGCCSVLLPADMMTEAEDV
ncbi:kelch-like protein 9 [Branchiostoma lanceolatum]|uniref:kelch-like protein 9 n=1 Tax=Branchiostoma lanceolatum TaxID=7740 RepID=UPI003452AA73